MHATGLISLVGQQTFHRSGLVICKNLPGPNLHYNSSCVASSLKIIYFLSFITRGLVDQLALLALFCVWFNSTHFLCEHSGMNGNVRSQSEVSLFKGSKRAAAPRKWRRASFESRCVENSAEIWRLRSRNFTRGGRGWGVVAPRYWHKQRYRVELVLAAGKQDQNFVC